MRETDGIDERRADLASKAKGGDKFGEELIRRSIVGIDGKAADSGSAPMVSYSTRTRKVLNNYFDRINVVTQSDVQDFIDDAVVDSKGATFKLPEGFSIQSVKIRETSGVDEMSAARLADKNRSEIGLELVASSILEVDGIPVSSAPSMESWSTRTRTAIQIYWAEINVVTEDELGPFIAQAMSGDPPESAPRLEAVGTETH